LLYFVFTILCSNIFKCRLCALIHYRVWYQHLFIVHSRVYHLILRRYLTCCYVPTLMKSVLTPWLTDTTMIQAFCWLTPRCPEAMIPRCCYWVLPNVYCRTELHSTGRAYCHSVVLCCGGSHNLPVLINISLMMIFWCSVIDTYFMTHDACVGNTRLCQCDTTASCRPGDHFLYAAPCFTCSRCRYFAAVCDGMTYVMTQRIIAMFIAAWCCIDMITYDCLWCYWRHIRGDMLFCD